jgi:hypothetical protein
MAQFTKKTLLSLVVASLPTATFAAGGDCWRTFNKPPGNWEQYCQDTELKTCWTDDSKVQKVTYLTTYCGKGEKKAKITYAFDPQNTHKSLEFSHPTAAHSKGQLKYVGSAGKGHLS